MAKCSYHKLLAMSLFVNLAPSLMQNRRAGVEGRRCVPGEVVVVVEDHEGRVEQAGLTSLGDAVGRDVTALVAAEDRSSDGRQGRHARQPARAVGAGTGDAERGADRGDVSLAALLE